MPLLVGLVEHRSDGRVIPIYGRRRTRLLVSLMVIKHSYAICDVRGRDFKELEVADLAFPPLQMSLSSRTGF